MSLKHSDFGLNPEHPPLVKMVAAVPLLPLNLRIPALQGRNFKIEAFLSGKDFVFKNDFNQVIFRARLGVSLLTLLLVLLVFLATQEMFGTSAGFIALGLLVFDPNLLAHGAVVGTDMGLSCFMFASVYVFYRYVKVSSLWRLFVVGIAMGLALAAKHTAILVFPMLIMLAICEIIRGSTEISRGQQIKRFALALVVIGAIAVAVLWAFYGFRYQARPDGFQLNPPMAEVLQELSRPHEARLLDDELYPKLQDLSQHPKVIAWGEIGLDYHYDNSPREVQREAFKRQLRMARERRLPISIHTREAEADTLAILDEEWKDSGLGGVIHCFTGTRSFAEAAVERGFLISFSGVITFKKAEDLRETARRLPIEKLLIETDSPFLAPVPYRGRRNEPAYVVETARAIAELRGTIVEAIGRATSENFTRLFKLA